MKIRIVYSVCAVVFAVCSVALSLFYFSNAVAEGAAVLDNSWTDHYSSTVLDSRWFWVREDSTHWSLTDRPGFMRLKSDKTIDSTNNLLLQNVPFGDYEIQTHFYFTPTKNFQIAGLIVYQDDANLITFGRAHCNLHPRSCAGNGIYFNYISHGEYIGSNNATATTSLSETYLKLVRHGAVYTGSVSTDGTNWTVVGVKNVDITPLNIGLKVSNQILVDSEAPADFDFFTVITSNYLFLPLLTK